MRLLSLLVLFVSPLAAWDRTGHTVIAMAAYQNLSPDVRSRVDGILQQHPDYAAWIKDRAEGVDAGLAAFIRASIWPDTIRGDPRFYNEAAPNPQPTPVLPGLPDMKRHGDWHYVNPPHGAENQPEPDNVVGKLYELQALLSDAYYLSWFIHLTGDLHQPMHAYTRYTGRHLDANGVDEGDRGGNLFLLEGERKNLHSYWDGAIGRDLSMDQMRALAAKLSPVPQLLAHTDPNTWMRESQRIAVDFAYTLGPDSGNDTPPLPSAEYRRKTTEVATQRIALAAYRLAAILNDRLSAY